MWPADYRCRATQVRLGMGVDGRASVTESASPSWTRVRDTASPSGGSALVRVRAQPTVMPVGPYEFGTVLGWPADYLCRVTPVGTMLGWPADYRCRATQGRLDLGVDVRVTESASPSSRSALVRVRARSTVMPVGPFKSGTVLCGLPITGAGPLKFGSAWAWTGV